MNKLRLGIAGYGGFGQGLTRAMDETGAVEIVGIYNRGEENRCIAEEHGYTAYADYNKLLKINGLEAVAIASANCVHEEHCILAAQAGKHIFCEKPLTLDLDSYDRIVEAAEKAGVVTHIDYTMRYGSRIKRLVDTMHSGTIGDILTLWVRRVRGYGLWAAGKRHSAIEDPARSGGWNIHHNIHGTDLLMYMADQRVTEVYAKNLKSTPDTPTDEINLALLTFENGSVGYVSDSTSILREGYYGAIGTKGTVLVNGTELILKMEDGTEARENMSDEGKNLVGSCQAFIDTCLGNAEAAIPFSEGRHCLEVLLAMNESSDNGEIVRIQS
jgi:predicted dehydrogenase